MGGVPLRKDLFGTANEKHGHFEIEELHFVGGGSFADHIFFLISWFSYCLIIFGLFVKTKGCESKLEYVG